MIPQTPAPNLDTAIRKLHAGLRGREDHASFCGVLTCRTAWGLVLSWRDTLRGQSGHIITVPRTSHDESAIVNAIASAMADWKKGSKEKHADGQGSID